jgi:hypothetical protein
MGSMHPTTKEDQMERPAINLQRLIGILMRDGRPVHYAFIDGRKVERSNACAMFNTLHRAYYRQGKKVGA